MARWTTADIPPQGGRLAVITGGNSGIGFETALALAGAGAGVVLAVRDTAKGEAAAGRIRARYRQAAVEVAPLDLARLASVADFAAAMAARARPIDMLINNAGVLVVGERHLTADGFELQFGVNYLGHFALTALLWPLLAASRVVQVASLSHRRARMDFDDLPGARRNASWRGYGQSKLAMLIFALELDRRLSRGGTVASIAAHPGVSATNLFAGGPTTGVMHLLIRLVTAPAPIFLQSSAQGALPILYAATSPASRSGGYYGPDGIREMRGYPTAARIAPQAQDRATAARLWQVSEQLTGISFVPG